MKFNNSYFEDEVQDGFFVPSEIKRAWAAELEVLSEIDKICKKHNIQYFADWGTLLAAVRHEGFIPWDDDLDIVMKRVDYIKFMEIAQTELPEGFSAYNFRNHDDLWLFLGRVVGKKRICFEEEHLEHFHQFPYIAGVDIFVLDYVSRDKEAERERDELALHTIALADLIGEGKGSPKVIEQVVSVIENMPKEVAKCKVGYEVAWTRDTVYYDKQLVDFVQESVDELGYSNQKINSGAGHDAQFASYMLPTTMIFVPSKDGHSHCEPEFTSTELCTEGASVLLNAVLKCDAVD